MHKSIQSSWLAKKADVTEERCGRGGGSFPHLLEMKTSKDILGGWQTDVHIAVNIQKVAIGYMFF